MSRKQATTTNGPSSFNQTKEASLAFEMWLTGDFDHGPVEERGATEEFILKELQRRGPRKRSGNTTLKMNFSKYPIT
jgi:hypothetical protein